MSEMTFNRPVIDEVVLNIMGEEYKLPTIKHEQYAPMVSLYAAIVELHNRVQALEAELKGD